MVESYCAGRSSCCGGPGQLATDFPIRGPLVNHVARNDDRGATRRTTHWGRWMALALVGAGCLGACKDKEPSPSGPKSSANARASARPRPARPKAPSITPGPCRAIAVSGSVTLGNSKELHPGDAVDGKVWVNVAKQAKLVIRHGSSSREYALVGPARALPCRQGEEQVLLESGEFKASQGGGAGGGRLVDVATPLGNVRYGNATLTIRATSQKSEVVVHAGSCWLEPASGAQLEGPQQLTGPKAAGGLRRSAGYSVAGTLAECEKRAQEAENKAKSLFAKVPTQGLGAAAAEQMRARAGARRACLVAEAALRLAPEPTGVAALRQRLEQANLTWQRVPERPRKEQK